MVNTVAERISVYDPSIVLDRMEVDMRQQYFSYPVVLFPSHMWEKAPPLSYASLSRKSSLFVLVPADLVSMRCQYHVRSSARWMSLTEQAQLEASCEEAIQEMRENPPPHPTCEADAGAYQVAYWLGLFACRR